VTAARRWLPAESGAPPARAPAGGVDVDSCLWRDEECVGCPTPRWHAGVLCPLRLDPRATWYADAIICPALDSANADDDRQP
jgi:hypothetical protein